MTAVRVRMNVALRGRMLYCSLFRVLHTGVRARSTWLDSQSIMSDNALPEMGSEGGVESSCIKGQLCVVIGNPDGANFDHMGRALVSIFLAVGLDGLQDIMNISLESEPEYRLLGVLFFVILIFLCRLLLFNLCVAVVTTTFHRVRKDVADALKAFKIHNAKVGCIQTSSTTR
eukprot:1188009-Rhodomonas_salina.3